MTNVAHELPDPVAWDPTHHHSPAGRHWTTSNVGEAIPGVVTPLCWSIWGPGGERGLRRACHELGLVRDDEVELPERIEDRWVSAFYGRVAMQVEFMALIGDRLPGTSGQEAVAGVFGHVPDDMHFAPTRSRYLPVLRRWPLAFARFPARLNTLATHHDTWWQKSIARCATLDLAGALALLIEADAQFNAAETLQTLSVFGIVQPVFDALSRLLARAGRPQDLAILSGAGGAELDVVSAIWAASRGRLSIEEVIGRHGFHGPYEGELSSVVWREDPSPVHVMVAQYAERDDDQDPAELERRREPQRRRAEAAVLAALPRYERPLARAILTLARNRIPMRGVAKRSFLQALDVARAAARHAGTLLAEQGTLAQPDDVFYLTLPELTALPADSQDLIERRRARRTLYRTLTLPRDWTGDPTPLPPSGDAVMAGDTVIGIGVSPGVVTGIARVVLTPEFDDIDPDEILIAPTTDPSWASIMFISSGLVVDIGGPLSHAAVVARELGLPCVVDTGTGTSQIRTGDRIEVDGNTGRVSILQHRP